MGGAIGFGIRTPDGREVFMERWTNDLFWRICQPSFINGGQEMETLIKEARPKNKWPESILKTEITAIEYGIVLVDFPTRSIFSRNDYSEAGSLWATRFSNGFQEDIDATKELCRLGMVNKVIIDEMESFEKTVSAQEFLSGAKVKNNFRAILNDSYFKVDHCPERPEDSSEILRWCVERGWKTPICDHADKAWRLA